MNKVMSMILIFVGIYVLSSGSQYHSKEFLDFLKTDIIGLTLTSVDGKTFSDADNAKEMIRNAGQNMTLVLEGKNKGDCHRRLKLVFGRTGKDKKFGLQFDPQNPPKYIGPATNNKDINLIRRLENTLYEC